MKTPQYTRKAISEYQKNKLVRKIVSFNQDSEQDLIEKITQETNFNKLVKELLLKHYFLASEQECLEYYSKRYEVNIDDWINFEDQLPEDKDIIVWLARDDESWFAQVSKSYLVGDHHSIMGNYHGNKYWQKLSLDKLKYLDAKLLK